MGQCEEQMYKTIPGVQTGGDQRQDHLRAVE